MKSEKLAQKPSTWLPLVLIIVALAGFLGTSYWNQKREFANLSKTLSDTHQSLSSQLKDQNEQQNKHYMSFMKLSQEVAVQQTKINEIQNKVKLHKDLQDSMLTKMEKKFTVHKSEHSTVFSALDERLLKLKTYGNQQQEKLTTLEKSLKSDLSSNSEELASLQQELKTLKLLVQSQAQQLRTLKPASSYSAPSPPQETTTSVRFPLSKNTSTPTQPPISDTSEKKIPVNRFNEVTASFASPSSY